MQCVCSNRKFTHIFAMCTCICVEEIQHPAHHHVSSVVVRTLLTFRLLLKNACPISTKPRMERPFNFVHIMFISFRHNYTQIQNTQLAYTLACIPTLHKIQFISATGDPYTLAYARDGSYTLP